MSVIEDVRQVLQDLVTPDMKAIEVRLSALEKKVEENEAHARERHAEVMAAVKETANYVQIVERLARLEALTQKSVA